MATPDGTPNQEDPPVLTKHESDQINASRSQGTSFIDQESMHKLQRTDSADKYDIVVPATTDPLVESHRAVVKGLDLGPILRLGHYSVAGSTHRPQTTFKEASARSEGTSARLEDSSSLPQSDLARHHHFFPHRTGPPPTMSTFDPAELHRPVRRIITTHTPAGKAVFESDDTLYPVDPLTNFGTPTAETPFAVIQIHRTRTFPVDNTRPLKEFHQTLVPLADTKGPSCRVVDVPPGNTPFLHRTISLDYALIVKGEVYIQLDDGAEKLCKEGDVVVVRGANHSWTNRGTGAVRLFFVACPAEKVKTETGEVLEKTPAGEIFDPPEEDD